MNEYQQKAHDLLVRISPASTHVAAIRYFAQSAVYAVLALVEELRLIRKIMEKDRD